MRYFSLHFLFRPIFYLSIAFLGYSIWLNFFSNKTKTPVNKVTLNGSVLQKENVIDSSKKEVAFFSWNTNLKLNAYFYPLKKVQIYGLGEEWLESATGALKSIGIASGISLLFLDKQKIKNAIERLSYIKKADVKISLPDTLQVRLEAVQGKFIVRWKSDLVLISEDGERIAENAEIPKFDFFFIETSKPIFPIQENAQINIFLSLYHALPIDERDLTEMYSGIDFTHSTIMLYSKMGGIKTVLGRQLSLETLRKARYAYLYQKGKNLKVKRIDLRSKLVKYLLES